MEPQLLQAITVSASTNYCVSAYVKNVDRQYVRVVFTGGGANNVGVIADLVNGAITQTDASGTSTYVGSGIEDVGNGWYRIWVVGTIAQTTGYPVLGLMDGATGTDLASDTYLGTDKSVYIWGAQVEAGVFPTSYVRTTTATVARKGDVVRMTGTNFSDWYNQSEGTFLVDMDISHFGVSYPRILAVHDGTSSEKLYLYYTGSNTNVNLSVKSASGTDGNVYTGTTLGLGAPVKVSFSYALNNLVLVVDGATAGTNTNSALPTVTAVTIGAAYDSSGYTNYYALNGHISRLMYWPKRLSDSALQSLTS
mgnify:FL=1